MQTKIKIPLLLTMDLAIVWFSIGLAFTLRYGFAALAERSGELLVFAIVTSVALSVTMFYFRMYQRMWRYASIGEVLAMVKAVVIGGVISYLLTSLVLQESFSLIIALRSFETMLLLMGGSRFLWRVIRERQPQQATEEAQERVLIVGAGDCGLMIARELQSPVLCNWKVIGFIDDDARKQHLQVLGLPVLGNRHRLQALVRAHKIDQLIIAMPSVSRKEVSEVINLALATKAKVKIIPALNALITGRVSVKEIRDVSVEDLLGREPVHTDLAGIASYVQDKTVLVTGAGGSIGSELCRQLAGFSPNRLILLGHGENSIYTIEMELRTRFPWTTLETVIADIQDLKRMEQVFSRYQPQVVFHAAAHKHVPLMERNPAEAIKNNVFGTRNVADCADRFGAERFVLISSDKAVNPTSVMGATKRMAEMYVQSLDASSATKFVAVRFGNVLGSRGSVIPRFKQQIAAGGPVTVTHPEMVRYFMTIPEAVQLVIQAGSLAEGGEIFVLDMGEPVRILKLAEDLIRLSGFEPYVDIGIAFTGMREGEKLFEELLTSEEAVDSTQHERIYIGKLSEINRSQLLLDFKRLERTLGDEPQVVRKAVQQIVPMYEEKKKQEQKQEEQKQDKEFVRDLQLVK